MDHTMDHGADAQGAPNVDDGMGATRAPTLQEENTILRDNLDRMVDLMTALRAEIQDLCNQQATPSTPLPHWSPPPSPPAQGQEIGTKRAREKLPTLSEFDSKRHLWEQWLLQATLKLAVDGQAIGSAMDQFAYMYSWL